MFFWFIYIYEHSWTIKIGVERVNKEEGLAESEGYIPLGATSSDECDAVFVIDICFSYDASAFYVWNHDAPF